jgi:uncharacterized protein YbaR (Trm112 family)
MKRELLDILACPVCKGELALTVEKEAEREIITGALLCRRCGITYPIVDCIPSSCRRSRISYSQAVGHPFIWLSSGRSS